MPSPRPATWLQRLLLRRGAQAGGRASRKECLASPIHLDKLIEANRPASLPPTVCLCMIVKNEAAVIERCLASARPLITHWIVVDTGSVDGTQELVRRALADLPGECVERPWVDFAHNRSEALALARPLADYSLIIDADDEFVVPPGYELPPLTDDSYTVDVRYAGTTYQRPQLVRNALAWRYRGVLHEFLECDGATRQGHLPVVMRINHEGARSTDPQTYQRDAALLERALETETDPFLVARYTFYLAQSYRDCDRREEAVAAYLKRADLGFWDEEIFVSLLNAGRLMRELGRSVDAVLAVLARASAICPRRAEAAHAAGMICRLHGRNAQGCELTSPALGLEPPATGLFVEAWIYDYGLRDEFAVNAFWAGRHHDCLRESLLMLGLQSLPEMERPRILANAGFAAARLAAGTASWPEDAPVPEPRRALATRGTDAPPRVLVAVLAKQKAPVLPFFLERLAALDYPKDRIVLYVRTNNNTDATRTILRDWLDREGGAYAALDFDDRDLVYPIEAAAVHDWNATRLRVIRAIRQASLAKTLEHGCDFLLAMDVDNFVAPSTLRELVALDLPIVAPLVREAKLGARYANFHAKVDAAGYYLETPRYDEILHRRVTGLIELPVVHCTYLVRADVIPRLTYEDGSGRFDYVIFSDSARRARVPQYLDNRQLYGYLTLQDDQPAAVAEQLSTLRGWFAAAGAALPYP